MRRIDVVREPIAAIKLIPDRGLTNYRVEDLVRAIAEFYSGAVKRFKLRQLEYRVGDVFAFEIHLSVQAIEFYLITPKRLQDHFRQKLSATWPKATFTPGDLPPVPGGPHQAGAEMIYKRHDLFSLDIARDELKPLPSLLNCIKDMRPRDQALVQVLVEPISRVQWEYDAGKAWKAFQRGKMPRTLRGGFETVARSVGGVITGTMQMVSDELSDLISMDGKAPKRDAQAYHDPERQLMMRQLIDATRQKPNKDALRTWIRILVAGSDEERVRLALRALGGSYRELAANNELTRKDVRRRELSAFSRVVAERQAPLIKVGVNLMSTAEIAKLFQLPTAGTQDEFPQVARIPRREVSLSAELFQDVPGIPLGEVTERGVTRTAKVPLQAYPGVQLKEVYDALSTPGLGFGKQGTGKSDGYGTTWGWHFIANGHTVFFIDTADGTVLRKFADSLPEDFPDEKLIWLDYDTKHWPIATSWADVACRRGNDADELEMLEIGDELTRRLVEYVDNNAHEVLSDRMRQYLTSAARAVFTNPQRSILDVELALKSPAYREELLADPAVLGQPDVVADLVTLQEKAEDGKDAAVTDPIIARLRMFSESRALANVFLQRPQMRGGKPVLDFRKWADNPEGGYGYAVLIHASQDAWGDDGQSLVLGFLQDKICLTAISRGDTPDPSGTGRRPFLNLVDEPHRFIKRADRLYSNAAVTFRKYRCKLLWLAHSLAQMGPAARAMTDGGVQFSCYKTETLKAFEEIEYALAPFTAAEAYESLAEKWEAVNRVRLPSGKDCPAFIAKMTPPPGFVRSREARRQECARIFGRPWKDVTNEIQQRRIDYQQRDTAWLISKMLDQMNLAKAIKEEKKAERRAGKGKA